MSKSTMELTGWDEAIAKLDRLTRLGEKEIGPVLYEGGKILADAVRSEINALPTDDSSTKPGEVRSGLRSIQKAGLQAGFGIAKMRSTGSGYNILMGFHGYNSLKTKAYPNGQPNKMIVRSLAKGTSFLRRNDFVAHARASAAEAAEDAMAKKLLETIQDLGG